jgi:PadR family transcriptional regulator PadR
MPNADAPRVTRHLLRILRVFLDDPAPHYGREIMQQAGLTSGVLYPALHRAESAGWVTSWWEAQDPVTAGRPARRYYALTPAGAQFARRELAELQGAAADAGNGDELLRDVLEALCRRDGLPLESAADPGAPARNDELALRLGIGRAFGLEEQGESS